MMMSCDNLTCVLAAVYICRRAFALATYVRTSVPPHTYLATRTHPTSLAPRPPLLPCPARRTIYIYSYTAVPVRYPGCWRQLAPPHYSFRMYYQHTCRCMSAARRLRGAWQVWTVVRSQGRTSYLLEKLLNVTINCVDVVLSDQATSADLERTVYCGAPHAGRCAFCKAGSTSR